MSSTKLPKNAPLLPTAMILGGILLSVFLAGMLVASSSTSAHPSLFLGGGIALLLVAGFLAIWQGRQVSARLMAQATKVLNNAIHATRERARAIETMANTLGLTLDYGKVLDAALNVGALGLKADNRAHNNRLSGMVLLFDKDQQLKVASGRGLPNHDFSLKVPGQRGILGNALGQAEPLIAGPCSEDPELSYFVGFHDSRSVLVIPLRAGFQNYGLLVYGSSEPNAFSAEHVDLLAAIGAQATIALQNAVLYEDLRQEKERIIAVEEDARKKLARDLHDGPTQSVSAIAMRVNFIRGILSKDPDKASGELEKVEDLAHRTTREIRHMLFTLRPLVLETQGLSAAFQQFRQKMKDTHNLDLTLEIENGIDAIVAGQVQGVLFYIAEEAVNNARKHAQAAHHIIRLYRRENYLTLEVVDDGVGFDVAAVEASYDRRSSLGMLNMRERAQLVNGTLVLDSAPGRGTRITVLVPLAIQQPTPPVGSPATDPQPTSPKRPPGAAKPRGTGLLSPPPDPEKPEKRGNSPRAPVR